jgi:hypothetical protein
MKVASYCLGCVYEIWRFFQQVYGGQTLTPNTGRLLNHGIDCGSTYRPALHNHAPPVQHSVSNKNMPSLSPGAIHPPKKKKQTRKQNKKTRLGVACWIKISAP